MSQVNVSFAQQLEDYINTKFKKAFLCESATQRTLDAMRREVKNTIKTVFTKSPRYHLLPESIEWLSETLLNSVSVTEGTLGQKILGSQVVSEAAKLPIEDLRLMYDLFGHTVLGISIAAELSKREGNSDGKYQSS